MMKKGTLAPGTLNLCAVFRNEYKTELLRLAFILPYTALPSIHAPIFTCTV